MPKLIVTRQTGGIRHPSVDGQIVSFRDYYDRQTVKDLGMG
jgi:hypothetical protein